MEKVCLMVGSSNKLQSPPNLTLAMAGAAAVNVHQIIGKVPISIRFVRKGCTNRPFFHIVVAETKKDQHDEIIEQVGSYDPLTNQHNEKLVAFNFERIRFWIGNGAEVSRPVEELLGLAGFFPIHPGSYMLAWRNRQKAQKEAEAAAASEKPPEN